MFTKTINVTKYFIRRGTRCQSTACPVALAIHRAGLRGLSVDRWGVFKDGLADMRFPKKVSEFIERFDNGEPVKPFSFVLRISNKNAKRLGLIK